jgi:hypothetical protein
MIHATQNFRHVDEGVTYRRLLNYGFTKRFNARHDQIGEDRVIWRQSFCRDAKKALWIFSHKREAHQPARVRVADD